VRDDAGQLVGTLAVFGPKHRIDLDGCLESLERLRSVADRIAGMLGSRPGFASD
jgi:DNA-binding IclR family transcriptional regulator